MESTIDRDNNLNAKITVLFLYTKTKQQAFAEVNDSSPPKQKNFFNKFFDNEIDGPF